MLSGTLVTAAGFLPIATAKSSTGEYTFDMFSVTTIALVLSWFAAIIATPLFRLLDFEETEERHGRRRGNTSTSTRRSTPACAHHRLVHQPSLDHDIGITAAGLVLASSVWALTEKQFFPTSDRTEVMVEMWCPRVPASAATEGASNSLEALLKADKDGQHLTSPASACPCRATSCR